MGSTDGSGMFGQIASSRAKSDAARAGPQRAESDAAQAASDSPGA
jgi:hypothetical protein